MDHGSLVASLIGISIPVFFLAILLKYVFAVELGWLPTIGRQDVLIDAEHPTGFYVLDGIITLNFEAAWDAAAHLILPAIALGSIPLAILARITRASVLDVQNEDYVRTARAKGVGAHTIDRRHIFRNAMLPVVTIIGLQAGLLLSGAILTETVFAIPGHGNVAGRGDREPRLSGAAGRDPLRGGRLRDREPARGRVVCPPRPTHQGELVVSVAQLESAEIQLEAPSGLWSDAWRRLIRNPGALVGFGLVAMFVLTAVFAPLIAPYDPREQDLSLLQDGCCPGPSAEHWFGVDQLGRDEFSRVVYGARFSLLIGVVAVSVGVSIGLLLGSMSGFFGGKTDSVIMRLMDIMLSIPGLLMAIGIAAMLGPGLFSIMIAIGVVNVPIFARLLRGSVLGQKGNDFVLAARAIGVPRRTILVSHILPNAISPIIVAATLALATAIIDAAGLGFLGLGPQDPSTPEWGTMLTDTVRYLQTAPHLAIIPGIAIVISVLGFNLIGDGLREALDPKLRGR